MSIGDAKSPKIQRVSKPKNNEATKKISCWLLNNVLNRIFY
jgi:hypothetical protein